MKEKKNYERSVIKLGNSMAITFPQEWYNNSGLKERSKVFVYPLNHNTIIIHGDQRRKDTSILKVNAFEWPQEFTKQLVLTAFKLNIDKLFLKYNPNAKQNYYNLTDILQRELIGFDTSITNGDNEYCISFLLDISRSTVPDILIELFTIFDEFIENLLDKSIKIKEGLYLENFSRKYHLGMRVLISTLLKYPDYNILGKRPIIRTLGDRVTFLYAKELMEYAFQLVKVPNNILEKYSNTLSKISKLYLQIIKTYNDIKLEVLRELQKSLELLNENFEKIKFEINLDEVKIRNIIARFFSIFDDLLEISITRVLETEL